MTNWHVSTACSATDRFKKKLIKQCDLNTRGRSTVSPWYNSQLEYNPVSRKPATFAAESTFRRLIWFSNHLSQCTLFLLLFCHSYWFSYNSLSYDGLFQRIGGSSFCYCLFRYILTWIRSACLVFALAFQEGNLVEGVSLNWYSACIELIKQRADPGLCSEGWVNVTFPLNSS